jgi:hypothetical protein
VQTSFPPDPRPRPQPFADSAAPVTYSRWSGRLELTGTTKYGMLQEWMIDAPPTSFADGNFLAHLVLDLCLIPQINLLILQ